MMKEIQKIKIGDRYVGEGEPTFIVAEIGQNHNGDVAIARALINNPKVIFADEPTGNLDSKSGQAIMKILQEVNEKQKRTIILITHETYTAEHAGRIIKLHDGLIVHDEKVLHQHDATREKFIK